MSLKLRAFVAMRLVVHVGDQTSGTYIVVLPEVYIIFLARTPRRVTERDPRCLSPGKAGMKSYVGVSQDQVHHFGGLGPLGVPLFLETTTSGP